MTGQGNDSISEEIERLKKEKERIEVETALITARRANAKAKEQPDPLLAELQRRQQLGELEKSALLAEAAVGQNRLFGDVKGGPFTGTTDINEKVGVIEATLLASAAIEEAATSIARRVEGGGPVAIFAVKDFPTFQRVAEFRARKQLLARAFASAGISVPTLSDRALERALPLPALAGASFEVLNKLLGWVKADYTVRSADVKLDESMLAFAVAGALTRAGTTVRLPAILVGSDPEMAPNLVAAELSELAALMNEVSRQAGKKQDELKALNADLAVETDASRKASLQHALRTANESSSTLVGLSAAYQSFLTSLTAEASAGTSVVAAIVRELALEASLREAGVVLLLKLDMAGGGHYTKKSLLTGLGGPALYHMGGAAVSFVALRGGNGIVIDAGAIPVHGGFVRTRALRAWLQSGPITGLRAWVRGMLSGSAPKDVTDSIDRRKVAHAPDTVTIARPRDILDPLGRPRWTNVVSATDAPYNAIGRLRVTRAGQEIASGTCWRVGANTAVTAAHVVEASRASDVGLTVLADFPGEPAVITTEVHIPPQYQRHKPVDPWDIALVRLSSGARHGSLELGTWSGSSCTVIGFPNQPDIVQSTGAVTERGDMLLHQADVTNGHSGGPVFGSSAPLDRIVRALHVGGFEANPVNHELPSHNVALVMREELGKLIKAKVQQWN